MSQKNKIALIFIELGLISAIALSLVLPEEKLILALSLPSALVGAGLAQWSSSSKDNQ
ncbi:MAG: hypothetical protein IM473_18640 [Microcystis sp. M015S2]|jgi:hypothetical protein|uniref:Uncharacterized protein n=1 Tax=Microcystis aeruginosa PCC 9701 TaxID=721123 RepID=I4IN62_MICAE|nr:MULTISPECIES: hypothetical protein [Microcystis]MCA2819219.1 hypothetical protein [Microcystis sp. M085S1]MCA2855174.1 hypothetical protein [Microcystis sp. M065S1]MCZ8056163.1 hypothetical protein [Microcystis sp. LE19-12.2C]MCA2628835.1 hypothetical protein [Microcystis sp. M091S2]MCA2644484.1 hypothetical protein [Microcystis sp. M069S2]